MTSPNLDELFPGPTESAVLMRRKDWSATSLGPPDHWPHSLKTIVRVLLTSRFAMWMGWGPELTFFYNDAYAAMTLGAKHPWALGRPSREVWAEIWPEIGPRIERVLKTGEATWDEDLLLFLERSGYPEESYHTFSYSPVTDDAGSVCGHLCVVTEQTERVIGERRMALLRDTATAVATIASINDEPQLFGALQEALHTGLRDLPFTLTYLFAHEGQKARLACRSGIEATHPAAVSELLLDGPDDTWPLREALAHPDGLVIELAGRKPGFPATTWNAAPTRAFLMPIVSRRQQRSGVFITALNPFRPLDAAYRSFIALLVGQIAAAVANAQAYQEERRQVEALAQIDRAKTAFFSNVSHEFRTPLTLMMGPIEDLLLKPRGQMLDDNREAIAMVQRNGVRLMKLVNTLLDFSRIEAGRVRARLEPVDLSAVTADLASTFQSAMERAGLAFEVNCPPLREPVYIDRDMWEKIVLNLISNAFKFTLHGRVAISIAAQSGRAVVRVEDTGTGIPRDQLPHVFDRFHRVEGARGRSHEGSGIGLALVSELVKLHGGELTVESEAGRGSAFTVSIPIGLAQIPPDQIVPATAASAPSAASSYAEEALRWLPGESGDSHDDRGETNEQSADPGYVLLADDNADMRDYARRLLSQRWRVEAVGNGREALIAARRRRPDVIVSDIMMPELDGFGLLRELRADAELQTIPVVLLSARAGEEARLEGLAASADDYLVKPFSARDLLARVDAQRLKAQTRAIERRHAQRLANLFTHAPVPIAVLRGPQHVYELANEHYTDLVGGRPLVGKPIHVALPELAGQGIFERLDAVWRTGEPYIGKSLAVTLKRGPHLEPEQAFFDFVYQPVIDTSGCVEAIVVVAHDVTTLATVKQEAEAANRLKDEFLATLSHELRTPLNAVLGYTQMLRDGVIAADRVPAVLETIERNAKLQEQLVSDVLDVSRMITGKLRLDVQPVNLADVVQSAIDTVTPAAAAKGVSLQPPLEHPALPVAGDAQRLQQVVWNLLSNAVKFTPRDGRVQVQVQRVYSHVEIAVSDTGEGIAPEFLPRLFQRFQQADGTLTRPHSGLGLGLAISRHLVEAHGGYIEASSPGRGLGTTVRVKLPLMIAHERTAPSSDRRES